MPLTGFSNVKYGLTVPASRGGGASGAARPPPRPPAAAPNALFAAADEVRLRRRCRPHPGALNVTQCAPSNSEKQRHAPPRGPERRKKVGNSLQLVCCLCGQFFLMRSVLARLTRVRCSPCAQEGEEGVEEELARARARRARAGRDEAAWAAALAEDPSVFDYDGAAAADEAAGRGHGAQRGAARESGRGESRLPSLWKALRARCGGACTPAARAALTHA